MSGFLVKISTHYNLIIAHLISAQKRVLVFTLDFYVNSKLTQYRNFGAY